MATAVKDTRHTETYSAVKSATGWIVYGNHTDTIGAVIENANGVHSAFHKGVCCGHFETLELACEQLVRVDKVMGE